MKAVEGADGLAPHSMVICTESEFRKLCNASALGPPNATETHEADLPHDPSGPARAVQPDGVSATSHGGEFGAGGAKMYCAVAVGERSESVHDVVASGVLTVASK